MNETNDILAAGWRGIAHSYALVNQFHCLELLRRGPAIRLYFEDLPYYNPSWKKTADIFGADCETALRSIPPPPADLKPDAEIRIAFPFDLLRPSRADRTCVFGTAEFLMVSPRGTAGGVAVAEAQQRHGFTLLTPSVWSKHGFVRSGVADENVVVVPHGFDPAIFRPATQDHRLEIRRELGVRPEDFVFLNSSAMTQNKGLHILLPAFAELTRSRPHVRLLLKGMDALYSSKTFLDYQLDRLGAGDRQSVIDRLSYVGGALSFAKMARLYQASDCYVSPYIAEAFNLPVLEAAGCGLPVICTDGGSTDDFVSGDFALRINSTLQRLDLPDYPDAMGLIPDREHLADLMLRVTDDAEFRRSARERGPQFVGKRFTWEKVVDRLLRVLLPE